MINAPTQRGVSHAGRGHPPGWYYLASTALLAALWLCGCRHTIVIVLGRNAQITVINPCPTKSSAHQVPSGDPATLSKKHP